MNWNLKALISIVLVFLFVVAILYKKMSPTLQLKNELESTHVKLIGIKSELNSYHNNNYLNKELKAISDVQFLIIESISNDEKIKMLSFTDLPLEDRVFKEFFVEVSGTQSALLTWYSDFDKKFNDAVRTEVSLSSKKGTMILKLFFKIKST